MRFIVPFAALLLPACAVVGLATRSMSFPQTVGELTAEGLPGPVEILRDDAGIPHIRAQTENDAWFALGFVHGQDRLFQADMSRRLIQGRISEWIGEDFVDVDAFHQALDVRARAEELPQSRIATILKGRLGLELRRSATVEAFEILEVDPRSAAQALGLRPGDFLLAINGVALVSNDDLRRAVARLRGLGRALVVVRRGPGRYHLTLPLL